MKKMPEDEPRVWMLGEGEKFIELDRYEDCGRFHQTEDYEDEDDEDWFDTETPVLLGDEPWVTCAYCESKIEAGDITILLTHWEPVFEEQTTDYPLHGNVKLSHLGCLLAAADRKSDDADK